MKTIFLTETTQVEGCYAATIGFFDGVHLGHQYVISQLKTLAAERNLPTMLITFEQHPRRVLHTTWQPQLITSLAEKEQLIAETGIDLLVVMRFSEEMARLSACCFMHQVLINQLNVKMLLTGYDNHFGCRQTITRADGTEQIEGFKDYVSYGQQMGMEVKAGQPLAMKTVLEKAHYENAMLTQSKCSSSLIRRLLNEGSVNEAAICLGRPYTIEGQVIHGEQIGRTIGFPTANIEPDDANRLIPKAGVYAIKVRMENGEVLQGMMNIGNRPTFNGEKLTLEANLFDFIGNLYNQQLTIAFYYRLRDEHHFDSPTALAEQIEIDAVKARELLNGILITR